MLNRMRDHPDAAIRHLSSWRLSRLWRFVAEFPETSSGKIQKFILRNQIMGT
jgi:fatty-acyl-CoA synthase